MEGLASSLPSSDVTVCAMLSLLSQTTVVPFFTVSDEESNWKFCITIKATCCMGAGGPATGTEDVGAVEEGVIDCGLMGATVWGGFCCCDSIAFGLTDVDPLLITNIMATTRMAITTTPRIIFLFITMIID